MAEHIENLISYIKGGSAPLDSIHVGEVVPDDVTSDYVFLQQREEQEGEALDTREPDEISYDCEVFASEIATQRALAKAVKTRLKALPAWGTEFENKVEAILVDDHTDDYIPKSIDGDIIESAMQVSALSITLLL